MKKRLFSLILAVLMTAGTLASCSSAPAQTDDTAAETTPAVTTEAETTLDPTLRANHFDNLPADLNYNGAAVTVLFRGTKSDVEGLKGSYWIRNDVCGTDNIGDPVSDAVWERNKNVAERLNITLSWVPTAGGTLDGDRAIIRSSVMAASDDYNMLLLTGNTSAGIGMNLYMRDISEIPHVDYTQPWWWEFANEALSMDGKSRQFIVGDMLLTNLSQTGVTFFNKDLYQDAYGDPDDLYRLTLDGKLTLDKVFELAQGRYKDVNGDGKQDAGDIYGLCFSKNKGEELSHMFMGCDLEMYTVKDGKLTIGMENDRSILAVEKMYKLLNETGAAWSISEGLSKLSPTFIEGHAMFMFNRLGQPAGDNFRAMEQQFGILPIPKLDEAQENYVSYPHDSGSVLSVPMNVDDKTFEMVGATMEALCGEAHRTYIDAFLEMMLKSKYSRDALSGQCIDIVMSTLTKNTLMEYATYTASIVSACLYNPAKSNPSGFASAYASKLTAAQNAWDKAVADIAAANAK